MKLDLALEHDPRNRLSAIWFGRTERLPSQAVLAYRLQRDEYQGMSRISLMIEHLLDSADADTSAPPASRS